MLDARLIGSDIFLGLSLPAQALYFHLSGRAEEDGYVSDPEYISRQIGIPYENIKDLETVGFVIPSDDGILVIQNWILYQALRLQRG